MTSPKYNSNNNKSTNPTTFDVVVVGSGVAGCAAVALLNALSEAKDNQLSIALVEKNEELGGILRGPDNLAGTWQPQTMSEMQEMNQYLPEKLSEQELASLLQDSNAAFDQLLDSGMIDGFKHMEYPAYRGNSTKGTVWHQPKLSCTERVKAIVSTFFLKHFAGRAGKDVLASFAEMIYMKPGYVYRLTQNVRKLPNVKIFYNTEVASMTPNNGASKWNLGTTNHGVDLSTNHVIFASGGFAANKDHMQKHGLQKCVPHYYNNINSGILETIAAEQNYLVSSQASKGWYCEATQLKSGVMQCLLFLNGDSQMVVNPNGQRVYNEKLPYDARGRVCLEQDHLILILDGKCLHHRCSHVALQPAELFVQGFPSVEHGQYVHGSSAKDLAAKLKEQGLVKENFEVNLAAQLRRFNSFVKQGVDEDFGRHKTKGYYEPDYVPPMAEIDSGDLYALVLLPSLLDTCCGPAVNGNNQVIKQSSSEGEDGVYAIGNAAGSLTKGMYYTGGVPSWNGIVGAYRAASHIVGK